MRLFALLATLLAFFLYGSQPAHAAGSSQRVSLGALLGNTFPSSNAGSSRFGYGLSGMLRMSPILSVGADYVMSNQEISAVYSDANGNAVTTGFRLNLRFLMGNANYHLDGFMPGLALGLKLGLTNVNYAVINSASATNPLGTGSTLTWGPKAQQDIPISSSLSVGWELSYLFVGKVDPMESFKALNLFLSGRWWLF